MTISEEYDASLDAFRRASKTMTTARLAYRARTIGDEEFLRARAEFDTAQEAADIAERKFIEETNKNHDNT